ncbi:MAG: FG-GAP-like repeat-containing protein, partial [Acidobacteriaceae bacterium]
MCFPRFASTVACLCVLPGALAQVPTAANLAITSGGAPISTITQGTVVTLTATVTLAGGAAALPPGQVDFCEAPVPPLRCTDIRLLGTAQLGSAGTATLKLLPGPGIHTYQALFLGTHLQAASSSAGSQLTVTPSPSPTQTVLAASGVPGNYTLTATVTNFAPTPITGSVSFHDVGVFNSVLASAPLVQVTGPALSFVDGPQLSVSPSNAEAIAIADFNNDGKPDIVAADCPSIPLVTPQPYQSLQVLLGNGNATFGSAPGFSIIPKCGQSLAVADFNQDGNQDVAAAMNSADAVQIMLGNGDGTFTKGQLIPLPSPQTIVSADFNGDGIPDLAVTNVTNNTVTILLGNGDGTFTANPPMPAGNNPIAVAVGDFRGIGIVDLAIVDQASNSVTILLGNGDGTFTPAPSPAVGVGPNSIVAADFNGDGILDLAVLNKLNTSGSAAPGSVTILLGNGDGTFTPVGATPATGLVPVSLGVGDFNGDGKADLTTADTGIAPPPGSSAASILLGNGNGTFALASNTPPAPLGTSPDAVAVADFDGAGVSDVAVAALDGLISIILPQFGTEAAATVGGISPIGNGPHQVDAKYPGDSNNLPSTSNIVYLTAEQLAPTLTLTLAPAGASYSYGQQFVLTVTISPIENLLPTGTLAITYQGVGTGIVLLGTGSTFTFNLIAQPVGTFPITAKYSGDSNYLPATGSLSITVKPNLSAATLTSSLNPANAGQTVTFTATVTATSASGVPPAGSVSFSDGTTVLGTVPLVSGSSGTSTAAFSTSTLTVGTHSITANYIPAAGYAASAASLTQAINPAPVDFTITLASPTVTLQTYQNSTTTVTLASLGGFA